MRTFLKTSTAIAMLATAIPAAGAQEAPAGLVSAYETYAAARLALSDTSSPDFNSNLQVAAAAREDLSIICSDAGAPDLAACFGQFIPADQRIPGDTNALPEPQQEAAPEPAVEEPVMVEETPVEEPLVEEPAAEEPVAEEPVAEEPAAEEPAAEEPAAEPQPEPQMEPAAAPEAAPEPEPQPEPEVIEEVTSEPELAVEAEVQSETGGNNQISAAYKAYAAERLALSEFDLSTEEGATQLERTRAARKELEAICADTGAADLATCLEQNIAPDMRIPGDTDALPEAMSAEQAPQPEAAPEAIEEDLQGATEEEMTDDGQAAEPVDGETESNGEVAPVLDSAKESDEAQANATAETSSEASTEPKPEPVAEEESAPPPESDSAAQSEAAPVQIQSIDEEQGEQVSAQEAQSEVRAARREAPREDARVVQEDDNGFRIVLQFGDNLVLRNSDSPRLTDERSDRFAVSDRYVERLRQGRTRETIERADGSRLVTIYNRNGDILRRSRFTPDGREFVLVYVDEDREEDVLDWRDPAEDLPPLRLNIPAREYILDAQDADEDEVERFLEQPPVENVQRLYSVDEVKRSARVRDMVRRLEVGGLTFDTGKASIPGDQISSLNKVANAMLDLLEQNPAETFLIEGHTDAVGSDISNLDLSDRRAETVAVILTEYFDIPPENLATQGYGERYLKIRTQQAERLNRRVTIKRITPLIAPVASR